MSWSFAGTLPFEPVGWASVAIFVFVFVFASSRKPSHIVEVLPCVPSFNVPQSMNTGYLKIDFTEFQDNKEE